MNIEINKSVREKFHSGFKRTKPVKWLVVHGTAGGGTLHWVESAQPKDARYRNYKRGIALFHYLIDRDGTVTELIDPDKWVYHASINRLDAGTIGVELLNKTSDNSGGYTVEQYNSLIDLFDNLKERYNELDTIISHNRCKQKISGGSKVCPGPSFNWDLVCDFLESEDYSFTHDNKYESIWGINHGTK